jgi:hypothetical protein
MGCRLAGLYTGESATKGDGFFAFYEAPSPIGQEAQPAAAGGSPSPVGWAGQGKLGLEKTTPSGSNGRRLSLGP